MLMPRVAHGYPFFGYELLLDLNTLPFQLKEVYFKQAPEVPLYGSIELMTL
jgi:hypothetical protein